MTKPLFSVALNRLCPSLDLGELELIGRSGIERLELYVRMLDDDPQGRKKAALGQMGRSGGPRVGSLHAGGGDLSALEDGPWRLAIEETLQGIELAGEFGVGLIVLHASGEPVNPEQRPRRLEQARRSLREIAPAARRHGVKLAIETLPRTCLGNTLAEIDQVLADLPEDVFGVCIDTNHLMGNYHLLCSSIVHLKDRLLEIHASDYDGVDERHALPGTGVVDWQAVSQTLRSVGFTGPLNYEVGFKDQPDPRERIRLLEENFRWLESL